MDYAAAAALADEINAFIEADGGVPTRHDPEKLKAFITHKLAGVPPEPPTPYAQGVGCKHTTEVG